MNTNQEVTPPPKLSGIASKLLTIYVEWQQYIHGLPKTLRHSLGIGIDKLFVDIIGLTAEAQFSPKEMRIIPVSQAIIKNDTLKFMLYVLFELKGINSKKFLSLSIKIEEVGRMLYGWKNQCPKIPIPKPAVAIETKPH